MIKYLYIAFFLLVSCRQTNNTTDNNEVAKFKLNKLTDKTEKILWRENIYDEKLKDTFNIIIINDELCETLTDPEIAALGYVATFIGNECEWDGEYKDDRSNLKCKILSALDLGYQCSDKHLGFLKKWFSKDPKVLEELNNNCPTTPFTASSQDTFDEITLTIKGNKISVSFNANGINMPMGESWNWTETNHFLFNNNNITLIKKEKSEVVREHFNTTF